MKETLNAPSFQDIAFHLPRILDKICKEINQIGQDWKTLRSVFTNDNEVLFLERRLDTRLCRPSNLSFS